MGRTIIKQQPDLDFYVEWSFIVDGPISYGTRKEMAEYLEDDGEERLRRTDLNGTSALWPSTGPLAYSFGDDDTLIYQQQGILRRHNIKALCERLAENEHADVSDLLEPFED